MAHVNEKSSLGWRPGWIQGPSDVIKTWLLSTLPSAHLALLLGSPWDGLWLSPLGGVMASLTSAALASYPLFLQQEKARVF